MILTLLKNLIGPKIFLFIKLHSTLNYSKNRVCNRKFESYIYVCIKLFIILLQLHLLQNYMNIYTSILICSNLYIFISKSISEELFID